MRARIDRTGEDNIAALIDAAYSDSFFAALARLYPVELRKPDIHAELNHIARIYVALRRIVQDETANWSMVVEQL